MTAIDKQVGCAGPNSTSTQKPSQQNPSRLRLPDGSKAMTLEHLQAHVETGIRLDLDYRAARMHNARAQVMLSLLRLFGAFNPQHDSSTDGSLINSISFRLTVYEQQPSTDEGWIPAIEPSEVTVDPVCMKDEVTAELFDQSLTLMHAFGFTIWDAEINLHAGAPCLGFLRVERSTIERVTAGGMTIDAAASAVFEALDLDPDGPDWPNPLATLVKASPDAAGSSAEGCAGAL